MALLVCVLNVPGIQLGPLSATCLPGCLYSFVELSFFWMTSSFLALWPTNSSSLSLSELQCPCSQFNRASFCPLCRNPSSQRVQHWCSCSVVSDSLWPHGLYIAASLLCPWNFPGRDNSVSCHFLLQWIFPTQGLNLHLLRLLHWQTDSLTLSHPGSQGSVLCLP